MTNVEFIVQNLSTNQNCINRVDPYGSYNARNLDAFFRTIDAMARFPNTLGVLVANHLINDLSSEKCAPVIMAIVRDLKRYMRLRGQRLLPVGFGGSGYKRDRIMLDFLTMDDGDGCLDFWTVCNSSPSSHLLVSIN
jgi:hypothetical protein